jgi:hypothetical protein
MKGVLLVIASYTQTQARDLVVERRSSSVPYPVQNVRLPACQRREAGALCCVSENQEAAPRKPQTNSDFESAGFAFVSSTSPKDLVNLGSIGHPHPLSSSTKVLPQADPKT